MRKLLRRRLRSLTSRSMKSKRPGRGGVSAILVLRGLCSRPREEQLDGKAFIFSWKQASLLSNGMRGSGLDYRIPGEKQSSQQLASMKRGNTDNYFTFPTSIYPSTPTSASYQSEYPDSPPPNQPQI